MAASPIAIVKKHEILNAWNWLVRFMSPRPDNDCGTCVYDQKMWGEKSTLVPLQSDLTVLRNLAILYLTSQLMGIRTILDIVHDCSTEDLMVYQTNLDADVRAVIESEDRFRDALSEHLAFWTRLATEVKGKTGFRFACALPNFQPEDKGPDGLFLSMDSLERVEVYSVKNSIGNPKPLISSSQFRKNGVAARYKQLDDFWLNANKGLGLLRLDRLLDQVSRALDVTPSQSIRMGLLAECSYNAIVVANQEYAGVHLFEGYERINRNSKKRIATYIGSRSWIGVSKRTRRCVKQILEQAGVK